ncbi:MAG: glycosyltransferase [Candidatus Cloacimonetes bacterium]|nr:glycosyltransferase [Candidatus Cloacimonadota bacterium]MBL7086402.1 glycosyltransferase [Candidatus Cloacimonadota bacterium]
MKRKILLFIKKANSSFVLQDEKILNKYFKVKIIEYGYQPGLMTIRNQIRLFGWLLKNIWSAKFIYIWFADYHSFLPVLFGKIFKKKSFLVLGGYDVTYIPEINYGSFSNPLRTFCTKFSIKNTTLNLPVSDYIEKEVLEKIPNADTKIVYTGHSKDKFVPSDVIKQKIVLTVGGANSYQRIKIKGIDFFLEVAKKIPEYNFIAIGIGKHAITYLKNIPSNFSILGKVEQNELLANYQKAKVYTQFSMREGLPSAVCEAMLCECIPVGFNNGGIPIAIGDCGFIIKEQNIDKAVELIKKAMISDKSLGEKARQRIMNNFSLEKRNKELFKLIME